MSRPQVYREVDLPDKWDEWPESAKVNYLSSAMDRDNLLRLVGEAGNVPEDEIGAQSIHKAGLAQLIVTLTGDDGE
jgi:hypothetical protein